MCEKFGKTLVAMIVALAPLAMSDVSDASQRGRGRSRAPEQKQALSGDSRENPGRGRAHTPRIYQDSASATGYENGHDLGLLDGRDGQRYDPVRHKDYRDTQRGYTQSYGSREGYRTNFRSGFRQGYEDGYREGARTRR